MSSPVRVTPTVRVAAATGRLGPVAFKLENLQRTGSFKLRGAVRKLGALAADERAAGVVTSSAGNHGAGLALAARALDVRVQVVVPEGTPDNKRRRIAALGADVIVEGGTYDEAEAAARLRASTQGAVYVSPYDDDAIIAGNGTDLGAELLEQTPRVARVLTPIGGGGLIGGLARELQPKGVEVWGAQPEANCAMYDSIQRGHALTTYEARPTLAEGCEGAVADRTYQLVRAHVADIALVSEEAIRRAVAFCYRVLGTIAEPSAAVPVAALLEQKLPPVDGDTVVVLTGGNIDDDLLDEILSAH